MKPAAIRLFTGIAVAGTILSSCNRLSFEHRKYRPGYYISWSGPVKHNTVKSGNTAFASPFGGLRGPEAKSEPVTIIERKEVPEIVPVKKLVALNQSTRSNPSRPLQNNVSLKTVQQPEQKQASVSREENKREDSFIPESRKKDKTGFYRLSGLIALLSAGIAIGHRKRLSKISRWSARNPVVSRWVQAAGHLVLSSAALVTGIILYANDVISGPATFPLSGGAFILTAMVYPKRRKKEPITPMRFMKAKMADLTLILSTTVCWASVGNNLAAEINSSKSVAASSSVIWQSIESLYETADHDGITTFRNTENGISGGQIAGIIGVSLAFVITMCLLAALSCTIYCSGNAPAAIFVGVFGFLLFAGALISSIKAIVARHKYPAN